MSTSASVYNLVTKEYFYLDRAYWLSAPTEQLLTPHELRVFAFADVKECAEGVRGWLEALMSFIEQDGVYVVVTDSGRHDFVYFTTFTKSVKNVY